MAAGTIRAKLPGVDIRLLMTPRAVTRRTGVGFVWMAIAAHRLRVLAVQQIYLVMVKIGHTIPAVMTFRTISAIFFHMGGCIIMIGLGMAGEAIEGFGYVTVLVVAAFAVEGGILIISLMMNQAKPGQLLVVNIGKGKGGHGHVTPPVFFMAILAPAGR